MPLLIKILTAIGARDMLAGGGDSGPPVSNTIKFVEDDMMIQFVEGGNIDFVE